MAHDLAHWVRGLRGRRVLLIGDLILDRYLYGDAERISPEAPVPVLRTVEQREAVGGCANVAACLAALGCRVECCGLVGKDRNGDALLRMLGEIGVEAAGVVVIAERPTTAKTRLVGLAQHRHRQQLLRVDEEDARPLPTETADTLMRRALERIPKVDVVCIEDYDKGVVTESLVQSVIREARKQRRPVLVDPARLRDYGRYRGADVVTPNREELCTVVGRRLESLETLAQAAKELMTAHEFNAVVVTVDRDGALLIERSGRPREKPVSTSSGAPAEAVTESPWRHIPTMPRSVYDNTGAGDAVLAMLAAATAAGADLEIAVRLANVAGGLEVEKFGCVPITADQVLAELRIEDRMRNGKLCTGDELVAELQLRRDRGETVAFTNGCFDILHAGHVDLLKRARQEASLLVVGLNGDASVRSQNKSPGRPINRFEHRAAVLGALECVDYVVGFDGPTPEGLIHRVRPDVLIKGEDWAKKGVVGAEFVKSIGGRVVLLPLVEGLSTTKLIERLSAGG